MDTKPWWQSKTIWGALIGGASVVLKIFHVNLELPPDLADQILSCTALVGTILGWIGLRMATKPIASPSTPVPGGPLIGGRLSLIALLMIPTMLFSACAMIEKYATPPNVELGVYKSASLALKAIKDPVKQERIRAQMYAAALAVRQYETTTVPTGTQLQAAIIQFTDHSPLWLEIANDVGAIWDTAVPHFGSGVAQAFSFLEAGARGFERAAAPPTSPRA